MFSINCPNCGTVNEVSAAKCRCGYDLTQGLRLAPGSNVVSHPSIKPAPAATDLPFDYRGRASRREYLFVNLGLLIALVVIAFAAGVATEVAGEASTLWVNGLLCLMLPLPIISVISGIRRLHDLGQSGWLVLLGLIPGVGFILQAYLFFAPGKPADPV